MQDARTARGITPWLTLAKISAAQAPEGPPPMTATRIGLSSAMLTFEAGLRICCTPARPPATRLKADEGMRASILLCRLANLFGELALGELLMKSEIPFDAVRCPPSAGGIYEFPRDCALREITWRAR